MKTNRKFGLFTSICMIIGIVIGSGIFFKSDNVLEYTQGNVLIGIGVFVFAAIAIIFGSLTMAELSIRTENAGGIIAYAEKFIGTRVSCAFGWFQNFVYYPTITSVVSWVVGIYGCILFNIDASLELQIFIGFLTLAVFHLLNYYSAKAAGYFQNISTIIKLIPIIVIAVMGIFFGDPNFALLKESGNFANSSWLSAIGPIAFSYDGWIIATTMAHEIKDSKRNLPIALIVSPIFILIAYLAYFVGLAVLIGPQEIIRLGDAHVDLAANLIFGDIGSKVLLVFIVISVMGTSNGLILGNTRGLYALGVNNMMPGAKHMAHIDAKSDTPTRATLLSFVICSGWMLVHYITTKNAILGSSDVSEIAIVTMYLLYSVLYLQVIKLKRTGEIKSCFKGYILPVMAIFGALIIFYGGMQNPMFLIYTAFSAMVLVIAYGYARKKNI